jgi:anti-sigma factor RsiW
MTCDDAHRLIQGYADRELDLRTSLDLEQHLSECAGCASEYRSIVAIRTALKVDLPYYQAPTTLIKRIRSSTRAAIRTETGSSRLREFVAGARRWPVAAAAAVVLVAIAIHGLNPSPPSIGDALGREVVASHVRSLMANHLTDVLSSNQHTVKPWFDGKLDFAPVVLDLSAEGFPLVGGRLDYLDGHPVAALVYHYRLHVINLFTWPNADVPDTEPQLTAQQGYNSVQWRESGMEYWAVSDVAPAELEKLAQRVREGASSTSESATPAR